MSIETSKLIAKVKRLLPDFAKAQESFRDPEKIIPIIFPFKPKLLPPEMDSEVKSARITMIEATSAALEKIRVSGTNAVLSPPETRMLCSIILTVRPALLIQDDKYLPAPPPLSGSDLDWNAILEPHRDDIQKTCESVGRIEFLHSDGTEWNMGTGFLVANDVIMTDRHVAEFFCEQNVNTNEWTFKTDSKRRRIDYCEEKDTTTPREFKIKKILGIHDTIDLALFKVAKTSQGRKHPEPLVLASDMPDPAKDRNVYVVGYPTKDDWKETGEDLSRVFNDIYGVKRLQPGKTTGVQAGGSVLFHDCSTVGGNSGSCVIDIEMNQVIGLHFRGVYLSEYNEAIALSMIKDDAMLKNAGVNFEK